jgi:hypothetical protein
VSDTVEGRLIAALAILAKAEKDPSAMSIPRQKEDVVTLQRQLVNNRMDANTELAAQIIHTFGLLKRKED